MLRSGVAIVSVLDPVQKTGADDTAAPPDGRDRAEVERPAAPGRRAGHHGKALGVGAKLGREQRVAQPVQPQIRAARVSGPLSRAAASTRSGFSAESERAATASAIVGAGTLKQRGLDRPAAGALLASPIKDHLDHRLAGLRVALAEDVGGDLDQIGSSSPRFHVANAACIAG